MVTVDQKTAELLPTKSGPPPTATPDSTKVVFTAQVMNADGSVKLKGAPGESCAGWTLGFFQLQFVEVNHARYRGAADRDGSILVVRDKAPARPQQLCRDSLSASSLWYNAPVGGSSAMTVTVVPAGATIPASGEYVLFASFLDSPDESYSIVTNNILTSRPNRLYSVNIAFAFCTVLTVEDPTGSLHFLKHFYWNTGWDAHFVSKGTSLTVSGFPNPPKMRLNFQGHVHSGVPNDHRFSEAQFRDPSLRTCDDLMRSALPGQFIPSLRWT